MPIHHKDLDIARVAEPHLGALQQLLALYKGKKTNNPDKATISVLRRSTEYLHDLLEKPVTLPLLILGVSGINYSLTSAKLAAVKNLVTTKGNGWRGGSKLREVLNGVEKQAPPSSFRPERDPVKEDWLNLLHDEMDQVGRDAFNSCVIACADTLFYGQLRLGEVLPASSLISKYMSSKLPLLSDLSITPSPKDKSSAKLRLPCTKTQQSRGDSAVIINHSARTNPVRALSSHIELNRLAASDPLFSYQLPNDSLQVLTKKEFLGYCNKVWSRAGIKRITGHSFRIGGTTHYLTKGIPPDVVKAMGKKYIVALFIGVPLQIRYTHYQVHISNLTMTPQAWHCSLG
ncbi:hypothetical protein F5051DRAFT_434168 [Lentinula edodes]|nr:hypothetical protein F5051DRAFT_434168 [Lentinula edodes]